jgi:hypothetical protein
MPFGDVHRVGARWRLACVQRCDRRFVNRALLGLERVPVVGRVPFGALGDFVERWCPSPALARLCLVAGRVEPVEQIGHGHLSCRDAAIERSEGRINRADHGIGLSRALVQPLTLVEQRRFPIEPGVVERPPDLFQRETEFAPDQDLLQPQQIGIGVEAIARRCSATGHEQADGVVMMQRANGDAREPGDVLHLVCARASHDISLRPDAT